MSTSSHSNSSNSIKTTIEPKEKDLGGFTVRRVLPSAKQPMVGPWIFFDHMGPANFPPNNGVNVRPHPHINLATVTYLFAGEILHRDSLGSVQTIQPGDINLMVAGKGVVHSERESTSVHEVPHRVHGLQLWLALPVEHEEVDPAFYHYPASSIPSVQVNNGTVRVMMGSAFGVTSPVKTFSNTLYLEAHLKAGATFTVPPAKEAALYLVSGELSVGDTPIRECTMVVFGSDNNIVVSASSDARIVIVGGEPIGKRYIEWNFVSSRKERIEQAKRDWKEGRFPLVPDDEVEFIPLPE